LIRVQIFHKGLNSKYGIQNKKKTKQENKKKKKKEKRKNALGPNPGVPAHLRFPAQPNSIWGSHVSRASYSLTVLRGCTCLSLSSHRLVGPCCQCVPFLHSVRRPCGAWRSAPSSPRSRHGAPTSGVFATSWCARRGIRVVCPTSTLPSPLCRPRSCKPSTYSPPMNLHCRQDHRHAAPRVTRLTRAPSLGSRGGGSSECAVTGRSVVGRDRLPRRREFVTGGRRSRRAANRVTHHRTHRYELGTEIALASTVIFTSFR
jgi:hypothetical protein